MGHRLFYFPLSQHELQEKDEEKRHDQRAENDGEDIAFHRKVREGYLKMADEEPGRWLIVDATLPQAEVAEIIWDKVERLLSERGLMHE